MDKKLGDSAPPMREVVYRRIRENILLGVYQPGDHLKEAEIASNLGVSRTPVREALRRLKAEHFLVNEPHCGMVVSSIATGELEELYRVRAFVECMVIRKAAKNATAGDIAALTACLDAADGAADLQKRLDAIEAFNAYIQRMGGARQLSDVFYFVREKLRRMVASGHIDPLRSRQAAAEHRRIVAALAANDADAAEQETRLHLSNSSRKMI